MTGWAPRDAAPGAAPPAPREAAEAPLEGADDPRYQRLLHQLRGGVIRLAWEDRDGGLELTVLDGSATVARCGVAALAGERGDPLPGGEPARAARLAAYEHVARTGAPAELAFEAPDAREIAVTVARTAPRELTLVCRDVTARRDAERARRDAEVRFAQAFHGRGDALAILRERDRAIVAGNAAFLMLVGCTPAESVGKALSALGVLSAGQEDALWPRANGDAGAGARDHVELDLTSRTGERRTVVASLAALELDDEGPCTLAAFADVTPQRAAERAFAAGFHHNPSALVIARASDHRIVDANARMLALIGRSRAEVLGATLVALGVMSEHEADAVRASADVPNAAPRRRAVEVTFVARGHEPRTMLGSAAQLEFDREPCILTAFIDITARKRAEHAFHTAFHTGLAGALLVNDERREIVDVNEIMLELTGFARNELRGRSIHELCAGDGAARARAAASWPRGAAPPGELELRRRGGGVLTLLAASQPIAIDGAAHSLLLLTDITSRKRSERWLATEHACSRELVEADQLEAVAPRVLEALCRGDGWDLGALWLTEPGDLSLRAHGTWYAPDLPAAAMAERIREVTLSPGEAFPGQAVATRAVVAAEISPRNLRHPDAPLALGLRHAAAIPIWCGGHVLGAVALLARRAPNLDGPQLDLFQSVGQKLGLFIDRARAGAALRVSEDRLRGVIDALQEGLLVADSAGRFSYANPAAVRMHDYASAADLERQLASFAADWELSTLSGQVLPVERWPLSRVIAGEVLHGCELIVRRRDRDWQRVFSYGGSLAPLSDGGHIAVLTVADVTERVRAATALRELHADLERRVEERTAALAASNRDLEAFSYSISHDLRAPLRTITGFTAIALDEHRAALPPDAERLLTNVLHSGRRLGTLIDDLLSFARLGRAALRLQDVDTDRLVREVVGELVSDRAGRALEIQIAPLAPCRADPSLLRQVWVNLVDNALKYSRDRDPAIVDIYSEREGPHTVFHVRDNGVGFDPRRAERLFGVFQRLHRAQEFEGTGVGLANVRRIVERHGGKVWASSTLGAGSTFSFHLGPEARP